MRVVRRAINRLFWLMVASISSQLYVANIRNGGSLMGIPPMLLTRIETWRSERDWTAEAISEGVAVRASITMTRTSVFGLSFWSKVLASDSLEG